MEPGQGSAGSPPLESENPSGQGSAGSPPLESENPSTSDTEQSSPPSAARTFLVARSTLEAKGLDTTHFAAVWGSAGLQGYFSDK
jgi:hypothetical protein